MGDATQFAQLLTALQGGNNDSRKEAEAKYEQLCLQPVATIQLLVQMLAAPDEAVRQQGAVLLRQLLKRRPATDRTKTHLDTFPDLPALRAALLASLEKETARSVATGVAHVIAEVAENGHAGDTTLQAAWPDLLPKLFQLVQQPDRRLPVLLVLKELAEALKTLVAEPAFASVVQACLQDPDTEVQATALVLVCEFAQHVKAKEAGTLKQFLPMVFELAAKLAEKEPKQATKLLGGINDVAEENPALLKDIVASHVLTACVQFGQAAALDKDVRKIALEVLVTLSNAKKGKLTAGVPGYNEAVVSLCVAFAMDLDPDVENWTQAEDDDQEEEDFLHEFGKESLDLYTKAMGGEKVLPLVFAALQQLMQQAQGQNSWLHAVAALALMATVAEFMENMDQVDEMVRQTLQHLVHPHARVRHAAWGCLAQFAGDHDPHVAEKFSNESCEGFLIALDDPVTKVLQRALEAFQITAQYMDRDSLEAPAAPILQKLAPRTLQAPANQRKLCAEGIATISVLAQQMEEGFAPYYPHLMPVLLSTMRTNAAVAEGRECFGRCLECIGFLGKAAGATVFRPDATAVMQVMLESCTNLSADDVATEYVLTAAEKICETLKKDFAPFVPGVLPLVLAKLNCKPQDIEGGALDLEDGKAELTITVLQTAEGSKVLGLKTSAIEDMQNALMLVKTMIDELKEAFAPHVKATAEGVLPVFEFELGEEVREVAFEVWGSLITTCKEMGDPAAVRELLAPLLSRVLEAMETTDDLGWELTQANGLASLIKAGGAGVLQQAEVTATANQVFKLLNESFTRRKEIADAEADDEDDAPEEEDDDDDFNVKAVDMRIRTGLCEILGALMMHHGDLFVAHVLPQLLTVLNAFLAQADPRYKDEDRKLAVYVVDDMLEHLGERCVSTWNTLLPPVIEAVGSPNHALAQAAAYGLALAAKLPAFAPMGEIAAAKLRQVLPVLVKAGKKKKKAQSLAVRDNAVSALGHLLRHHPAAVPEGQRPAAWGEFLSYLPLKTDEEEAQKVHQLLVQLVQGQEPSVIGPNFANVPKILGVLVEVYDTEFVSKETTVGIHAVVKNLGQAGLAQFGGNLSAKHQKKLERMWRESQ